MHLYIGYQNYSSWSLRPWLAMKMAGIEFTESVLPFYHDDSLQKLAKKHAILPQVPVLVDGELVIPDTLAILEYLAERFPAAGLWPANKVDRAYARVASAEMHSGFTALRSHCPMNCRASKHIDVSVDMQAELDRLAVIWSQFSQRRNAIDGDFLCGEFCIADAMYAPVLWRVLGYKLRVSEEFSRWSQAMLALQPMQLWLEKACAEPWTIQHYDNAGFENSPAS